MRWSIGRFVRIAVAALGLSLTALWIRSHMVNEVVFFTTPEHRYIEIASIPGQLRVTTVDHWPMPVLLRHLRTDGLNFIWPVFGQGLIRGGWFPPGFALIHGSRWISPPTWGPGLNYGANVSYRQLAVPFGTPVAVCAIIAFWPLLRSIVNQRRRRARVAAGFCPQCGYDLRASGERCPECGRRVGAGELDFEKSRQVG